MVPPSSSVAKIVSPESPKPTYNHTHKIERWIFFDWFDSFDSDLTCLIKNFQSCVTNANFAVEKNRTRGAKQEWEDKMMALRRSATQGRRYCRRSTRLASIKRRCVTRDTSLLCAFCTRDTVAFLECITVLHRELCLCSILFLADETVATKQTVKVTSSQAVASLPS